MGIDGEQKEGNLMVEGYPTLTLGMLTYASSSSPYRYFQVYQNTCYRIKFKDHVLALEVNVFFTEIIRKEKSNY